MRYFTADLHLFHETVAKMRFPNESTSEESSKKHDNTLIGQMSKLKKGDQLWILGDISSGREDDENRVLEVLEYIQYSTGVQMHLISGNHDGCSAIHEGGWKKLDRFQRVFSSVQSYAKLKFKKAPVLLSHFPYKNLGDGPDREIREKYDVYRLRDEGYLLMHGHTHQTTPIWFDNNQFCVSWDAHRRLVTEDDIQEWVTRRRHPSAVRFKDGRETV